MQKENKLTDKKYLKLNFLAHVFYILECFGGGFEIIIKIFTGNSLRTNFFKISYAKNMCYMNFLIRFTLLPAHNIGFFSQIQFRLN